MALEQLSIEEIADQAVTSKIDIPEFQREFVWDAEQVKLLVESLYRGYPIGSFLVWDSSNYHEPKTAQGAQTSLWIVDGQQRTTALCLLLARKPYWWPIAQDWNKALDRYDVMVNVLPDEPRDHLDFALPNPIRRRDPRWISVRRVLTREDVEDLTPLAQEVIRPITEDSGEAMEVFGKVHSRMQRLWQIRNRTIPVVRVSHEVEDVAEIFSRLNRAGTRVREADVTLAVAAVRNPGWVRDQYIPYRDDLEHRGWDLDAGVFIRTLTGIGCARARLIEVPKDFWNPENLPSVWRQATAAMAEVLKRFAEYGIQSDRLLPSTNSLIALFTLHQRWHDESAYSFGRALHWFLSANKDGRYSGSAITSMNEDVRAIAEAPTFGAAVDALVSRLRVPPTVDPEDYLNRYDRAGNRFLRLMLYLVLYRRGAQDWVDGTRLGYDNTGSPITTGFQPQWHHMFPRSKLKKAGLGIDEINALANITVLNERTNVSRLSGKLPEQYIEQFSITPDSLRAHFVPAPMADAAAQEARLSELWALGRHGDFLLERAELLAEATNGLLAELVA